MEKPAIDTTINPLSLSQNIYTMNIIVTTV